MNEIDRRDALLLSMVSILAAGPLASSSALAQADPAVGSSAQIMSAMHGLTGVTIPQRMTVVGTGGSGCWPALFAAFCGVEDMLLVDAADVSEDDLGRTFFRPSDVGYPKAQALADIIGMFRPAVRVTARKKFVEPADEDIYWGTVIFDGVNYKPLNEALQLGSRRRNMTYVSGFYSGLNAGVSSGIPAGLEWAKSGEVPVWVPSAALSGILQIYSAFAQPLNCFGQPADVAMEEGEMAAMFEEEAGKLAK